MIAFTITAILAFIAYLAKEAWNEAEKILTTAVLVCSQLNTLFIILLDIPFIKDLQKLYHESTDIKSFIEKYKINLTDIQHINNIENIYKAVPRSARNQIVANLNFFKTNLLNGTLLINDETAKHIGGISLQEIAIIRLIILKYINNQQLICSLEEPNPSFISSLRDDCHKILIELDIRIKKLHQNISNNTPGDKISITYNILKNYFVNFKLLSALFIKNLKLLIFKNH